MSSPIRNLVSGSRSAGLQHFRASERWVSRVPCTITTGYQVKEFLARYPGILEEYLIENVSTEFLEGILIRKRAESRKPTDVGATSDRERSQLKLERMYTEIGIDKLARNICECSSDEEILEKIYEAAGILGAIVEAEKRSMYMTDVNNIDMYRYVPEQKSHRKHVGPMGLKLTVSAHVAFTKQSVNVADLPQDSRFPKGVGLGDDEAHHVIALPVLLETGRCLAVLEFTRSWERDPFSKREYEMAHAVLCWVASCVQKLKMNKLLKIQARLNQYLLQSARSLFDDMQNIDLLITKIMTFTKELVSADRCSLFLVDQVRKELVAEFFDEGKSSEDGTPLYTKTSQIRFSVEKGISGYVARTGLSVNIRDANSDERFNPEVDNKTGYRTQSVLCLPIHGKTGVISVMMLLNKQEERFFTEEDERSFQSFSVYSALALQYARIFNQLTHQQAKYKVAMDVLEFHIKGPDSEVQELRKDPYIPDDKIPYAFWSFDFFINDDIVPDLPKLFIKICTDIFGPKQFDLTKLCRFIITVRKNYRPVTYHNWQHGFTVAHSLWRIVKLCDNAGFDKVEKLALIFAGISHDIDHRGYNNDFFRKLQQPLAALYSTSTMEQHHYRQTVTILHAEGHDIFSSLSSEDHSRLLELIRLNILATDLSLYFGNQKFLAGLSAKGEFSFESNEHRKALSSIIMTAADLCAISKPWETQRPTIDNLYKEFYEQGDIEKRKGFKPMPMMDRLTQEEVPQQQIGFIDFICKPMYTTLSAILPETMPLLTGCLEVKERWKIVISEKETKKSTLIKSNV